MKQNSRITMLLLLVFFLSLSLILSCFLNRYIDEARQDVHHSHLRDELVLFEAQLEHQEVEGLDSVIATLQVMGDTLEDTQVTLFSREAELLYDSHQENDSTLFQSERDLLENEGGGEDWVQGEFQNDENRRMSHYYASTDLLSSEQEKLGILRLTKSQEKSPLLTSLNQIYILVFFLSIFIIYLLFTYAWNNRVVKPLKDIQYLAEGITERNEISTYKGKNIKEIDDLGYSINKLLSKLDYQMWELENRNEQLNKLIDSLNIGIMLLNETRLIKIVNPVMSEMLGANLSNHIDRPYIHFINNPWIIEMIETAYETGKAQSDEIILNASEEMILDASIVPIDLEQESAYGLIVLFYDITEIRRLERVRTDFVANASHELRTPVTALKGFTETLLDGALEDQETLIHFLEIMQEESERLDSIVGDILQLSRLEQGVDRMDLEEVNIKETVHSIFQVIEQKAKNKHIHLRVASRDDLTIYFDEDVLKQILLNLINNAVLYNKEGGYVEVLIEKEDEKAKIQVKDNGIGIQEQEQKRIFERFYRVDKARSRNSGGTGLGLSIVRHLVENSGGRVTLESQLNVGSTFTVFLPIYQDNVNKM